MIAEAVETPVSLRPFHQHIPGMDRLWHTYCADHPDFGTCSDEAGAYIAIGEHLRSMH